MRSPTIFLGSSRGVGRQTFTILRSSPRGPRAGQAPSRQLELGQSEDRRRQGRNGRNSDKMQSHHFAQGPWNVGYERRVDVTALRGKRIAKADAERRAA